MNKIYPEENNKMLQIMGRVLYGKDKSCLMAYPGITISLRVKAKQVLFCMDAETDECFFNVYIDGGHFKILQLNKGKHNYLLLDDNDAEHEIMLVRRTESWVGKVRLYYASIDGIALQAKPLPELKIICLGNSITTGTAAEKKPGDGESNKTSNAVASYGYLLGQKLNAQVQLIAYAGRGMCKDWEGNTDVSTLPQYYDRILPDEEEPLWKHSQYKADIITICIGTNDFNLENGKIPSKEEWTSAYLNLLQKIQKDHPRASIFLCDSPMHQEGTHEQALMSEYLNFIYQKCGKNIHQVWLSYQKGTTVDSHPTADEHKIIAQELYKAILKTR